MAEDAQRIGGRGARASDYGYPSAYVHGLAWLARFIWRRGIPALLIGAALIGLVFLGLRAGEGLATGDRAVAGQAVPRGVLSPDGRLVAAPRDDGSVEVRPATGGAGFSIRGHGAPVIEARFSDDGAILITVDRDGRVVATRLEGEPLARLREGLHGIASPESLRSAAWNGWTQEAWRSGMALEGGMTSGAAVSRIMDASAVAPVLGAGVRPAPGTMFRDCADCPQMVVLPPGKFMMGSPETEAGRNDDEGPQHQVTVPAPFAVGRFEVTVGEFRRFLAGSGHAAGGGCYADTNGDGAVEQTADADWAKPYFEQDERSPVACVSWNDAQAFVRWLSHETGESYRLLSESEWEYAARAGTTTPYVWGNDPNGGCRHGNGADASAKRERTDWAAATCDDGVGARTAPVGRYLPNAMGLFDMHGNVWEWVEDCNEDNYSAGQPSDGSSYTAGSCSARVIRGGSWFNYPMDLRSADRNGFTPTVRLNFLGFRVARTL